jgi:LmbE family N-acetylglucosaminyl deacetylase
MNRNILVVAAHPDDETLGLGGTIACHASLGDHVSVLFLTDGVRSRNKTTDTALEKAAERRRVAATSALLELGATVHAFGSFPDNALDTVPLLEIVRFVENAKDVLRPKLIYTHHGGDLNIDHRLAAQAVMTAFRPQPHETWESIHAFEVPSSTGWGDEGAGLAFAPDTFIDVTPWWNHKAAALKCYEEEMRPAPHARSHDALEALARWRGASAGFLYAEALVTRRRRVQVP